MLLEIFLIILAAALFILRTLFKRNFSYWLQYPEISSTSGRIFNGKCLDLLFFRTNFGFHLKAIYEAEKFQKAPVVGLYGLYKPGLLIREPSIIQSVLIKDFDCFHNRSCRADYRNDPTGALGLFFDTYTGWRKMRQILSTAFSSGKMKYMYPLLQKVGERLQHHLQEKGEYFTLELKETCGQYTTEAITTTLMGFVSNALENRKEYIYQEAVKLSTFNRKRAFDFLVVFFAPILNPLLRPKIFYPSTEWFMRSCLQTVMDERERSGAVRHDLIDVFLKVSKAANKTSEVGQKCPDNLVAQACLFMLGGYETSATSMSNVLFELAKDDQAQKKLREEMLCVFKEERGEVSYEILNKMEYLQMVVDEILRLYPVLPFLDRDYIPPSNRTEEFSLAPYHDYKLPSGMPVYISVYGLHHDPKFWQNPKKFDPERFRPCNKKQLNPMTYLPFGGGPRSCIGARLATLQIKVGLVEFLKNHRVQVCAETLPEQSFDTKSIVLQPENGIYIQFVRDNMYRNLKFA